MELKISQWNWKVLKHEERRLLRVLFFRTWSTRWSQVTVQKACAYDVRKASIRDPLTSINKAGGFEWQTAHTKGCQENHCEKGFPVKNLKILKHFKTLTMVSMEPNLCQETQFSTSFQKNFTRMDSDKGNRFLAGVGGAHSLSLSLSLSLSHTHTHTHTHTYTHIHTHTHLYTHTHTFTHIHTCTHTHTHTHTHTAISVFRWGRSWSALRSLSERGRRPFHRTAQAARLLKRVFWLRCSDHRLKRSTLARAGDPQSPSSYRACSCFYFWKLEW